MITQRDIKVIKFIEKFKVARTSTVQQLFYPSVRIAQRRLREITNQGFLKRSQTIINQEYMYYIKKPKQLLHSILLTDFYREIDKLVRIEYFENEVQIDEIRPDGILAYKFQGKAYIAFVEVEISNKGLDINKYLKLLNTNRYKKYFPTFPLLIAITNQNIKERSDFKLIQIKEGLENITRIVN